MHQLSKVSLLTTLAAMLLVAGLGLSAPSFADDANVGDAERGPGVQAVGNPVVESLTFFSPHEVKQIRATTPGNFLAVSLMDCCIAGDQWVQRTYCLQNGSIWDTRSKALGNTTSFTALTTAYKNGSQAMDCITEIRYGEGVAIFPAGLSARFATSAGSNVTTTILTTLVPLPSQ
jgi:hypothetical protein